MNEEHWKYPTDAGVRWEQPWNLRWGRLMMMMTQSKGISWVRNVAHMAAMRSACKEKRENILLRPEYKWEVITEIMLK